MNITDLIVNFVRQGNVVEFPGFGTLSGSNVSAYHDAATGTFYPARRTVVFTDQQQGNKSIVRCISDRECVNVDTAEQIWHNFVDALNDKLQRNPAGHEFPGLGTLRKTATGYEFVAVEGLDLDADKRHARPLENVNTYTPKTTDDPFAIFDRPANPADEAAAARAAAEAAEQAAREAAARAAAEQAEREAAERAARAEAERQAREAEERAAREAAERAEFEARQRAEREAAEIAEREAAARAAEEEARIAARKEEDRIAAEAAARAAEAARQAEKQQATPAKPDKPAKPVEPAKPAKPVEPAPKQRKRRRFWPILLIILLCLLLIGGAVYYFTQMRTPATTDTVSTERVDLPPYSQFSRSIDDLHFEEEMIESTRRTLGVYMADYFRQYLQARHYYNAFAVVMQRVDEYADMRLHELMSDDHYAVQRFFPFPGDFYRSYCYDELLDVGSLVHRCTVQGELMDVDRLDQFLDALIAELGLHPDGYYPTAATTAKPKAKPEDNYVPVVPPAPTFKESKQGFDIIAGCCTQKSSADRMANHLKSLGCDAYVINRSGLYYVSMGSAPTRTAAEALYSHIKSWYKGDATIKNFNE